MFAPAIPALNDGELEAVLRAATEMGARSAGYVLLRLPLEIKDLFREWLRGQRPRPRQARHVARPADARRQGLRQTESGTRAWRRGPDRGDDERALPGRVKRFGINKIRYRLDTLRFAVPESARTALVDAKRDARQMKLL